MDQVKLSIAPVLVFVKLMQLSRQGLLLLNVNDGTGAEEDELNDILSIAKEGSVPTPSSLLVQLIPSFTFGLLSALVGNAIVYLSQYP